MTEPTPPPTDLPTIKANAELALKCLCGASMQGALLAVNDIRAYLDALEREVCRLNEYHDKAMRIAVMDGHKLRDRIAELERGCQRTEWVFNKEGFQVNNIPTLTFSDALRKPTPPLSGNWRHSGALICCGTLRIAILDIDTNPSDEFKERLLEWVCKTLNAAQEVETAYPDTFSQVLERTVGAGKLDGFLDALRIASGCLDRHRECNEDCLFRDGIQTVINALEDAKNAKPKT